MQNIQVEAIQEFREAKKGFKGDKKGFKGDKKGFKTFIHCVNFLITS